MKYFYVLLFYIIDYVYCYRNLNELSAQSNATCLGKYCNDNNLDPSVVTNLMISVGCNANDRRGLRRQPCIDVKWASNSKVLFSESNSESFKLRYRIIEPIQLKTNYSEHIVMKKKFRLDLINKPRFGVTYEFSIAKQFKNKYTNFTVERIRMPESTPSDNPKNLYYAITDNVGNRIRVSWSPPNVKYHNGKITNYEVRYFAEGKEETTEVFRNVTNRHYVDLINLTENHYKIWVRAYTRKGPGIWSGQLQYYIPKYEDKLPVPKITSVYRNNTSGDLHVSWYINPADIGYQDIYSFKIYYAPINQYIWQQETVEKEKTNVRIKANKNKILSSEKYKVKVAAANNRGNIGHYSEEERESTKRDRERMNEKAVRELECIPEDSNTIRLIWILPRFYQDLQRFEIKYSGKLSFIPENALKRSEYINEKIESVTFSLHKRKISKTINNLLPNVQYNFLIYSKYSSNRRDEIPQEPFKEISCKTYPTGPSKVQPPQLISIDKELMQVKIRIHRVSERNGPISTYYLIISRHNPKEMNNRNQPDSYKLMNLGINTNHDQYIGPFIAFFNTPSKLFGNSNSKQRTPLNIAIRKPIYADVILGDGRKVKNNFKVMAYNRRLNRNLNYHSFLRVCVKYKDQSVCTSSPWSRVFNFTSSTDILNKGNGGELITTPDKNSNKSTDNKMNKSALSNSFVYVLGILVVGILLCVVCIGMVCFVKKRGWQKKRFITINTKSDENGSSLQATEQTNLMKLGSIMENGNSNTPQISSDTSTLGNTTSALSQHRSTQSPQQQQRLLLMADTNGGIMYHHQNSHLHAKTPDLVASDTVMLRHENSIRKEGKAQSPTSLTPLNGPGNMTTQRIDSFNFSQTQSLQKSDYTPIQDKAPIPICNLYEYLQQLKNNDSGVLLSEFETLNNNVDDRFSWKRSNIETNKTKNRYANVVAYDHTSVYLQTIDDINGSDYINANFIDGYKRKAAYIATQGPLPDTTDDFWRMVWEQNTSCIVMMTRLEERSGVKCHQYWPNRGFICYGHMIVCHVETVQLAYYTIRVFELRHSKYTEKREVKHFQFTAWPDHGVPRLSTPLLMFVRRYRSVCRNDSGPTVVHCSAGVGRTGAFIVIDAQLERIKQEKTIDVFNYVSRIRCQRNYMVQTQAQYLFIMETLLEAVEDGNTEILACNTVSHVRKLAQSGGGLVIIASNQNERSIAPFSSGQGGPLTGFELEFGKINNLASNRDRQGSMLNEFVKATGNLPINLSKNRARNVIPYDWNRVFLNPIRGIDGSDYINASFIDGYRERKAYIAAQSPIATTVEDFWRLIWDQHCGVVVMLNQHHQDKCHIYWPSTKSIRYQFFVVDPIVEYNMPNYILREFKVTDARDGESRTLRQFQFTQWPSHGCPKDIEMMLDFIRQVHKTKEQFGHLEPMVIHCSTGAGRTGVFIALSIAIDRLQQESVVDMYQTVKLLHKQRLGLVQTVDQYEFCYLSMLDYLSNFDHDPKHM